jgi:hypothetical protein
MTEPLDALVATIVQQRKYGRTTCAVTPRPATGARASVTALIDEYVATFGFKGLDDGWVEIRQQDARQIATAVLYEDLASHTEVMNEQQASELAHRFISLFGTGTEYYTNGNLVLPSADKNGVPGGWNPITSATFDSGVICVSEDRIGILWVQDED